MSGFAAVGGASVGNPMVLISKGRQHSIDDLANMTVQQIINIDHVVPARHMEAEMLRYQMVSIMCRYFLACIENEVKGLAINDNHCANDYDVRTFAEASINEIQIMEHFWSEQIRSQEWRDAALIVIGNMMATALHVERLWFIEDHPENLAAKRYKQKFEET